MDKLRQLSVDHDGIVFDDMSFAHMPITAVIHLLDTEFERDIHVRYGTVNIPANTKKIFTYNTNNPFLSDDVHEQAQLDAVNRRIDKILITGKLY